jgi:hypothetical protein
MKKPIGLEPEHLEYLDELRASGDTNMWGAKPYLMSEFPELEPFQAREILSYWMLTFSERIKYKKPEKE